MSLSRCSLLCYVALLLTLSSSGQVCPPPSLPIIEEQLDQGIIISWEPGGSETIWDVDFGLSPFTPSEFGPFGMQGVSDNSALSILYYFGPNETHDLYVRADCTIEPDYPEYSEWVGPLTFTTFTDACQFPVVHMECQVEKLRSGFGAEHYPVSCTGMEEGDNWLLEYTPSLTQEYFMHSDAFINSLMIREKDVCHELNWQCRLDGLMGNTHSLGTLEMNTTYQLLIRSENDPQVVIGRCESAVFEEYNLDTIDLDLTTLDFKFSLDGSPIEGLFDVFVVEEELTAPLANSLPTFASFSVINGLISISTDQLTSNTDYDLYIRPSCTSVVACWEGPFNFRTPVNCGEAPIILSTEPKSVNAEVAVMGKINRFFSIEIGEAPFSEPDPLAPGTNSIIGGFNSNQDTVKFTFVDLEPFTTYQYYLKRNCSDNSVVIGNQPWYGPFEFTTNGDCFVEVHDLNCGQCYASRPDYGHDYFEANFFCGTEDAPSRGERIFRIQEPISGQVTINRSQSAFGTFETIIYQFYLKSASEVCGLDGWTHLGCWAPTSRLGDIVIDVEADSVYYLMIDYQTESTFRYHYHRFEITADNCENECPVVQNLDFTPINEDNVLLSWDPEPGAIGYDLVSLPVGVPTNPYPCLYEPASLFEAIVHPDTFYVLPDLSLNEPRDVYVRSRCSEFNYGPWTMLQVESQIGKSMQFSNMGTLQYCSPSYTLNGKAVLYDQLTFSVSEDGWYRLQQKIDGSSFVRLYETSFDPGQPSQNLLATEPGNFLNLDEVTLWYFLEAEKDYVVVSSSQPGVRPAEEIELTISGTGDITSSGYEFLGIADGPSGTVPQTDGTRYISDQVCIDADGWRHYYQTDGTGINLNKDALLFSVMDYPELSNQVGTEVLTISGAAGTSLISNTTENYVSQPEGWITMNRFWDLALEDGQQPVAPIAVRFYYTEEDFQAMVAALPLDSILNHNDLSFYKINQNATGFNTNPAAGHLDVPLAAYCADEGYWEYAFASQADTISWSYGMHRDAHYAEMFVHEFSGGGGGIGSAINISTSVTEVVPRRKWKVYPNPIHQELFIRLENGTSAPEIIQCFNMNGQLIQTETKRIESGLLSVNTADWASGVYVIKMANAEEGQIEIVVKP